jgi:hypothetical protein
MRKLLYLTSLILFKKMPFEWHINILFLMNCIRLNKIKNFYRLNLSNPKTFNEKINLLKNKFTKEKALFADKLLLQSSVENMINEKIKCASIKAIFNDFSEFKKYDFKDINSVDYVIKANHGSGMNIFYQSGELPSANDAKKIKSWFTCRPEIISRENHYSLISKKVFVEEIIDLNINDYKIHCFGGKAKYIQVDSDRFLSHKRNIYNINWELENLEIIYPKCDHYIDKPSCLQSMIELAEQIACYPLMNIYVRIDFYIHSNDIYLGEITFHSEGGIAPFDSYESDLFFGSLIYLN